MYSLIWILIIISSHGFCTMRKKEDINYEKIDSSADDRPGHLPLCLRFSK